MKLLSVSQAAQGIEPTLIRKIRDKARPQSLDLGLGQPDLPVADVVRDAVLAQVKSGYAYYTPNLGLMALRESIAQHYGCVPEEVMITCGVQEGLAVAVLGLVNPGDDVLVPDPGFPAYSNLVRAAGANPVSYSWICVESSDGSKVWQLDIDSIRTALTTRTTAIILNSPSNPLGAVIDRQAMQDVLDLLAAHNIAWISDEIYEDFVYGDVAHVSPRDFEEHRDSGIKLSGASKKYHMMGWRIGWLIANERVIEALKPLHQHLVTCAPDFAQHAAMAALRHHDTLISSTLETFKYQRTVAIQACQRMDGVHFANPQGAFYIFLDVHRYMERWGTSLRLAEKILEVSDVITIPGSGFGRSGEGYLRLAYTPDEKVLVEALERVHRFFGEV